MSKRIMVDTQALMKYASTLSGISADLSDASSALSAIVGGASDIEYYMRATAPRLSGDCGASVKHGDVAATLASYANALKTLGGHCQIIAAGVNMAANEFGSCENNNTLSFMNATDTATRYDAGVSAVGATLTGGGIFSAGIDFNALYDAIRNRIPEGLIPNSDMTPGDILRYIVNFPENLSALGDSIIDTTTASTSADFSQSYYSDDNISVLFAEGSADASAGILQRDGDGNIVFSPYVTVGAGLSAGLFAGSLSHSTGDNLFGTNASVSAELLTANVGARGTVALMDEHSRVNPTVKLDASAELIVASADANIGVTVAGVDVNAGAEVSFGLGAHANVGLDSGVLTVDVGASVGFGASVSFSVDVGDAVYAVVDGAYGVLDSLFGF
ncbi:MAG: hypothetical protein Q4D04_12865 [Clostridia bacterium]|nr:hypothetical protein [Clostridia bacterium]